jgi:phenylacetate-CoA ligase
VAAGGGSDREAGADREAIQRLAQKAGRVRPAGPYMYHDHPLVAHSVMTKVIECVLGPSYFYHRRLIEASKGWSVKEIREYQETRFQRLIRRYGDEITQKDDYRRNLRRYTHWNVPPLAHTVRTGGTSGQPLTFQADTFARRQKERAYLFDIWSQIGYAPGDLRVCYRGEIHGGLVRFDRFENAWLVSPGATLEQELGRLRQWLRTVPPFFLHVHASSLFTFIELVGESLFRSLPIRGVIAGSEAFPVAEQQRFEQEFGIRVAHWYGHSEYAALAYCCRECRGFHFYPTYGHVEFLPSETEDCLRVIASSFNRIGTQFVRYDTGDLAVAPAGSCTVNHFSRADAIVGRVGETFVDSSGRRRSLFGYIFGDEKSVLWDQIRDLQVVQEKAGRLRVRLVVNPGVDRDQIEQIFERRMPMVSLEFEYVPSIERSPSGKRRYFVDAMEEDTSGSYH